MRLLRNLLMIFVLAGFFAGPVMAQAAGEPASEIKIDKKKLLVQPRNPDGSLVMVSFWEDPALWVREQQQAFMAPCQAPQADQDQQPYAAGP